MHTASPGRSPKGAHGDMSEGREYFTQVEELGNIQISEEVIASIAAVAAVEVEGVASLAANLGSDIAELLGKKNLSKGVRLQMNEDAIVVDLSILVQYGSSIQDVAKMVQDAVMSGVADMTGLKVSYVNVHVAGIAFPKPEK